MISCHVPVFHLWPSLIIYSSWSGRWKVRLVLGNQCMIVSNEEAEFGWQSLTILWSHARPIPLATHWPTCQTHAWQYHHYHHLPMKYTSQSLLFLALKIVYQVDQEVTLLVDCSWYFSANTHVKVTKVKDLNSTACIPYCQLIMIFFALPFDSSFQGVISPLTADNARYKLGVLAWKEVNVSFEVEIPSFRIPHQWHGHQCQTRRWQSQSSRGREERDGRLMATHHWLCMKYVLL